MKAPIGLHGLVIVDESKAKPQDLYVDFGMSAVYFVGEQVQVLGPVMRARCPRCKTVNLVRDVGSIALVRAEKPVTATCKCGERRNLRMRMLVG